MKLTKKYNYRIYIYPKNNKGLKKLYRFTIEFFSCFENIFYSIISLN